MDRFFAPYKIDFDGGGWKIDAAVDFRAREVASAGKSMGCLSASHWPMDYGA
jgi:hypothetical protein